MRVALQVCVLVPCTVLSACAADDRVVRIRPADSTWIQRGHTTRDEVVAKFGKPALTLSQGAGEALNEYAEYRPHPSPRAYGERGGTQVLVPIPQGPFPQVYPSAEQSGQLSEQLQPLGDRFWLRYDEKGIVRDFGFGASPNAH